MTTYTQAAKAIRALGLTVSRSDGEIRVAFKGNESAAYYTDCPEDALATAQHMAATAAAHGAPAPDAEGVAVSLGIHTPGAVFDPAALDDDDAAELAAALGVDLDETGPDWTPGPGESFYAQEAGAGAFAFGETPGAAMAALFTKREQAAMAADYDRFRYGAAS